MIKNAFGHYFLDSLKRKLKRKLPEFLLNFFPEQYIRRLARIRFILLPSLPKVREIENKNCSQDHTYVILYKHSTHTFTEGKIYDRCVRNV